MRDDVNREPCPWRIVDDAGGAYCFGLAGGIVWHSIGGARNAPKGHMFSQALSRVKTRVPILGGSFAVWGTLFSCFDCSFTYMRKKEDPWNAILSGAATGGLLAARAGPKVAAKNAAVGGVILAAIEGLNIVVSRVVLPFFERRAQVRRRFLLSFLLSPFAFLTLFPPSSLRIPQSPLSLSLSKTYAPHMLMRPSGWQRHAVCRGSARASSGPDA